MRRIRPVTIAILIVVLALPALARGQGTSTLQQNPPPFLGTSTTPARSGSVPHGGSLPRTGENLLLELAVAAGLLGVAAGLRVRPR
jgi:hypothetical protein